MRILICGVSGMIGHNFWRILAKGSDEVVGTLHWGREQFSRYPIFQRSFHELRSPPIMQIARHFHGSTIEQFQAADFDGVTKVLNSLQPNVIVNCIGITKRKAEANDVEKMFTVNGRFPHHLARWADRHGARVIHFSTDCVFDGAEGNYRERSVVTAPDLYGQTKYFGELDYDHCLTIRTSMIGREITGHTELLEWFLAQRGKSIKGFKNARYSGLTTLTMARLLLRIIHEQPRLSGRYQIAGPVINKYDLLIALREAFQIDVEVIADGSFRCDRTLQSQKFTEATGITIPSWKEMIAELAEDSAFYDNHRL